MMFLTTNNVLLAGAALACRGDSDSARSTRHVALLTLTIQHLLQTQLPVITLEYRRPSSDSEMSYEKIL